MDIVRVFNGLGNQMSQYAFYYAKKRRHPLTTFFITNRYDSENVHNGYELGQLFGIKSSKLKEQLLYYIYESLFKPLFGYRFLNKISYEIKEPSNYDYDKKLIEPSCRFGFSFYWGGWHCEKYFAEYKQELKEKVFCFDERMLNKHSRMWKDTIDNDEYSCSLHIRRGDFLKDKKWSNAITSNYYKDSISYMKEKLRHPVTFYVFSNDIKWCREKFGEDGFCYIDCNSGNDSWQDMYLMSRCRNHINANSSFSWWGAWLSQHDNGITVCPQAFISTMKTKDIYPESWIKI